MLSASFRMLTKANKILEAQEKQLKKAASLAVSTTAYKLYKEGSMWLKRGELNLPKKSELLKRPRGYRKRRKQAPLASLYRGIVYKADRKNLRANVGFLAVSEGTTWQARIAAKSEKGYTWIYPPGYRRRMHRIGIHLRKTTTSAHVPPRDIMGAVMLKKGGERAISAEIRDKFERKMRGERI